MLSKVEVLLPGIIEQGSFLPNLMKTFTKNDTAMNLFITGFMAVVLQKANAKSPFRYLDKYTIMKKFLDIESVWFIMGAKGF